MKLHLMTVGKPKFKYAADGWDEYVGRLKRLHTVRLTHLPDKYATDIAKFSELTRKTYIVVLEVNGQKMSSHELAAFLQIRELEAREVSFVIGGPAGLPPAFSATADIQLSLSTLTFPHDLAMLITAEAIYRASTLNAGLPYHK